MFMILPFSNDHETRDFQLLPANNLQLGYVNEGL